MIFGHRENVALRKLGNPDGFMFYAWHCLDASIVKMTGCVPTRNYTRGKRKGQPDYGSGPAKVVYVAEVEVKAEYARYEAETGHCGECMGEGHVFAGWSVDAGTKHRTCPKCNGVTKAAEPVAEAR